MEIQTCQDKTITIGLKELRKKLGIVEQISMVTYYPETDELHLSTSPEVVNNENK